MALVKCTTSVDQGGYRANVGDVIDTASPIYDRFSASFSAEDVELDTLVAGAPTGAYTQTYSTAGRTVAASTTATLVDSSGGTAADTVAAITEASTAGSADTAPVANAIATFAREQAALAADHLALKKVVTALIDDGQTMGLYG